MSAVEKKLPPGFKMQTFGFVLTLFGTVDTIMNLVTGITVDLFFLFLIGAGLALFAVGVAQKRKDRYQATCG